MEGAALLQPPPKLQLPLRGRANPCSKVVLGERAPRRQTGAVPWGAVEPVALRVNPKSRPRAFAPEPWHRGLGAVIVELHGGAARGAGTATATGPSGSHDGREKGRGEQGQGRYGGRGNGNGRPCTEANLWQKALASGSN